MIKLQVSKLVSDFGEIRLTVLDPRSEGQAIKCGMKEEGLGVTDEIATSAERLIRNDGIERVTI